MDTYHNIRAPQQAKTMGMGIHLSGANSNKSSIICCSASGGQLTLDHCFEKVGPTAGKSADDRVLSVLELTAPKLVAVDCPLSLPPCLACVRPVCVGQSHCDDIELAYLLALDQQYPAKTGQGSGKKARKKPANPQIHRTWDIARRQWPEFSDLDPTFTLNQLPLVHRGRILSKRLQSLPTPVPLMETNVLYGLMAIRSLLAMDKLRIHQFRSFELGAEIREEIVDRLFQLLGILCAEELYDRLWQSLEVFLAMFVALTSALKLEAGGLGPARPITVASFNGILLTTKARAD